MRRSDDITIDEARDLVADQMLWPLVRNFLWDFAPQVHESWIDSSVARYLTTELSPRLKRFILETLGVSPCFHTFPKDDWSRLLLLDGATLESIAKWLGALACADSLRRVTSGKTVRELKAVLPGVYPEVFGYTMYFKRHAVESSDRQAVESSEQVVRCGVECLSSFVSELPEPLRHRFMLKLPKSFFSVDDPTVRRSDDPTIRRFDGLTINLRLLLKLRFPEAYSLCC